MTGLIDLAMRRGTKIGLAGGDILAEVLRGAAWCATAGEGIGGDDRSCFVASGVVLTGLLSVCGPAAFETLFDFFWAGTRCCLVG